MRHPGERPALGHVGHPLHPSRARLSGTAHNER